MAGSRPSGNAALQHALVEGAEAVDGVGGLGEAVEGEVHLVAVGHGDEQEANGGGAVAFEQEVAEGVEVALGLGHLAAFDEEEADMHPVAGEGDLPEAHSDWAISFSWWGNMRSSPPAWRSKASPRNLVAMAEHSMCQPGRPLPRGVSQECLAGLGGLPEGEVAGGVLVVLVDVDAGAVVDVLEVLLGELAVFGDRGRGGSTSCRLRPGRRCLWRRAAG